MRARLLFVLVALLVGLLVWQVARHDEGGGGPDVVKRDAPPEERPPSLRGHPPAHASADASAGGSVPGRAPSTAHATNGIAGTSPSEPNGSALEVTWCDAETGRDLGTLAHFGSRSRSHGWLTYGVNPAVPSGYVAWDDKMWRTPDVPWVTRVRAVYPLRRAIETEVHLRREDGRAPVSALLTWSAAGRGGFQVTTRSTSVRLEGVPHLPGAFLHLSVQDEGARGSAFARIPPRSDDPLRVDVLLETDDLVVIKDAEISDHVETDNDLPYEESWGQGPPPTGSLEVWVQRRDGGTAEGIQVRRDGTSTTTDARGVVRYDAVMAGEHTVSLVQPGMVPTTTTAQVRVGRTETVRLIEREGASLDVRVVDKAGHPLPFAAVYVNQPSHVTWLDIDGDVQRLDAFTDELGRRRLDHVEPGRVRVRAQWANQWGWQDVDVEDGRVTPVRIVIEPGR